MRTRAGSRSRREEAKRRTPAVGERRGGAEHLENVIVGLREAIFRYYSRLIGNALPLADLALPALGADAPASECF